MPWRRANPPADQFLIVGVALYMLVFEFLHASDRPVGALIWGSACIAACSGPPAESTFSPSASF